MRTLKNILLVAVLVSVCSNFCASAQTIAEWDFTKKQVLKGNYPLILRGKSFLDQNGLTIPVGAKNERGGAATVKVHSELTPEGSFSVTVDFLVSSKQKRNFNNIVLLDNKYVPTTQNTAFHNGFMLILKQNSGDKFTPGAAFGFGTKSVLIWGEETVITPDKLHSLQMTYDERGLVYFSLDGSFCGSGKVPAGSIAKAKRPLHIGDRAGADHWHLGGTIAKVSMKKAGGLNQNQTAAGTPILSLDFVQQKGWNGLKLRGSSKLDKNGLSVLDADIKKPSGALLLGLPEYTPKNAFEITADVTLDSNFKRTSNWAMIFDSKYVAKPAAGSPYHKGFMFFLMPRGNNVYRFGAAFGYGKESVQVSGKDMTLLPGKPYQLSMLFTATGNVSFFLNGKLVSKAVVPAGSVAVPDGNIVIGDRLGANYYPFGGTIRKLELKTADFKPQDFAASLSHRRVFERGEKKTLLHVDFRNFEQKKLENVTVEAVSNEKKLPLFLLKGVNSGAFFQLKFPVDSYLLPGTYRMELSAFDHLKKKIASDSIEYTIVPAYGDFMPVVLWGNHDDLKDIRSVGFTHQLAHFFPRTGNFDPKSLQQWVPHLDANLKNRLYAIGSVYGTFRFIRQNRYLRTDRNGKVYPRKNLEASHPEVQREFAEAVRTTAEAFREHPAFDGVLINSEVRDSSLPSFGSGVESAAFKKFAGYDIPETVTGKSPLPYLGDKTFPWDRVISEDRKDLVFLKWFWLVGDGWNPLQTLLAETIRKTVSGIEHKNRFFSFYDPATRVPPMWGSGGNVDMISQWTYSYPDPIKIGQTTDEVIAMAHGKPGQKIASMTQAIWYRSATAPIGKKVKNPPEWLKWEPQATFISVAPDSLREAFWCKISRRLDAIMYHGVGSILQRTDHKLYRMTNYESRKVLKELSESVIEPLGPVLKRVPERPFEVAILESTASSFYAPKHFPMGWGKEWIADLHLALQWGHFQPGIVYDEHLLQNREISELKVLFVPGLEVITEPVLKKLNELRSKGVIIIGDEFTSPGLMVDHRLKSVSRETQNPLGTKKKLQELGAELSKLLQPYLKRKAFASNQDIVVRQRGNDNADYVFVVNDKRTFGDYVGQWGLVPEKGLENRGTVTVNHAAAIGYDLVKHEKIDLKTTKNGTSFDVTLGPGDGKLVLLLDRPIEKTELQLPRELKCGESFEVIFRILDRNGKPIQAILPVELRLLADGKLLPGSGYYAAENGVLKIKEVMATNLKPGKILVQGKCLASGKISTVEVTVKE